MRTIQTTAEAIPEHTVTVSVPIDVAPGVHEPVVVLPSEPTPASALISPAGDPGGFTAGWPVFDLGPWPEGFTVSREQIYADRAG